MSPTVHACPLQPRCTERVCECVCVSECWVPSPVSIIWGCARPTKGRKLVTRWIQAPEVMSLSLDRSHILGLQREGERERGHGGQRSSTGMCLREKRGRFWSCHASGFRPADGESRGHSNSVPAESRGHSNSVPVRSRPEQTLCPVQQL